MKIAVCGSGLGEDKEILKKSEEIGREIARSKSILLTGSGTGYPNAALKGALKENGKIVCYSPAKDKEEHIKRYSFPFEENVEYVFTGHGIPGRNLDLVQNSDAVLIISGKAGTLNEFTLAFILGKKIGILEDSGGIAELIPKIAAVCDKQGESRKVVYGSDAKELVKKIG